MDEGRDVCKVCGKARDEHYMAMVAGVPVAGSYEPDGNTPLYCSQVALQAQNAALMAVLEAASDAEWPYYSNREGDRYCVECDRLIASGPHSPNPHADDCRWGELWEAIKQARATLEAQP